MTENTAAADFNDLWELDARRFCLRRELFEIGPEVTALFEKAASPSGLTDLTAYERAILGLCLCYVTTCLALPEPAYPPPNLEASRN